ncbi:acetyl-CoA synthetase-like protein [Dothidotthia symphoricarpi CBS 119687]|uniref:Acetyl-CoA synthetase-like protein n=1 Tax=Dothidotthia symphoricarpi CBS 119687 TaxID=1392245 RepID=A0A6A6AAK7_9PLEO|nr:acetyl-CoA synthetase-like protein [Dothidotthia symphoricarpi CBS 119687]KAF2128253.1 acetyl-CoA synthetase-like protein [Dothidotthia symphoricarpi CBS 119687]
MEQQVQFSNISSLSSDDRCSLARFGRGPRLPVLYGTVHEAFEAIVDAHPTIVAAVHNGKFITYQQLDCAANRLANHLINSGLRPHQRVCLVVQRSLEMLIGILAILKAGCQYVPIDGGVASEQNLEHIIKDTKARFILCLPTYWNRVMQFAHQDTVVLELGMDTGAFYSPQRPKVQVSSDDGVYAMYTSGRDFTPVAWSTGVPKGVDVKHGTMTNALLLEPGRLRITVGSNVAQVLSISFAMGSWEMLGSLMNGGTLHLRGSDWNATLEKVDTLICTPSILSKYQQRRFPNIKTIVVAGEPCPQALADEWAQGRDFYNLLGSTEVFLFSAHRHVPGEPLSIGRPLPNITCYILDDAGEPVPFGQRGTLWVGGAGVSRGYIDLPLTTAEKYCPDKFANDGTLMFNFGNIVCWKADGSLDSFGRMDDQVKIKGFRVELDGVTSVIEKFHGITQAASLIMNGALHAFYVSTVSIDERELDAFTRKDLPYYSVPEKWIRLGFIPLNPNGKVDKVELQAAALRLDGTTTVIKVEKPSHNRHDSAFDDLIIQNEVTLPLPVRTQKSPLPSAASIYDVDLEKGPRVSLSKASNLSSPSESAVSVDTPVVLPGTKGPPAQAWLQHRALITYRMLLLLVVLANIGVACGILYRYIKHNAFPLQSVATATASNLCAAILIRSEPVINLLFIVFSSVPTWVPLRIRRICAHIYHLGGIHSGCAVAAVIWFMIFTVGISLELAKGAGARAISLAPAILSYVIAALLITMALLSYPTLRAKHHNLWENTHRFGGWTVLILYWILVGISTKDLSPQSSTTSSAFLHNPSIWLLTAATIAIVFPWLFLRRVPVRSEVLSSHAVRLHFDHANLSPGQGVRLAERPLSDWHGFATIKNVNKNDPTSAAKGFSVIVSRAGDFTGRAIDTPPTHIWKRGIPTCGVLRIATLFKSVVLVATGSGIGPCLSIFPYQNIVMRILWTASNHEASFGKSIIEDVRRRDPDAVIHNTRTQGKPDMSLMAYRLYKECRAEAVLIISNKRLTTQIVYDLERRGIPAYGAIFDS